ncbi:hypothetical protein MMG85_17645 [Pseudoxanthomonas sp. LH2527]|nr:hypothetical protein [Pseudoxanthomonas sp. LH2527]
MTYRTAIIYANLMRSPDLSFGRSKAYIGLDPSEKGAISYFLGVALTKAFVERKLSVSWLMHVDLYRDRFGVNLAPGERPDLFGEDALGRWIVAESKGRTNQHDKDALIKAKRQASRVIDVDGAPPHLSIGFVSSFNKGRLTLVADDPPIDEKGEGLSLRVSKNEFRSTYYRPFEELLATFETRQEQIGGQEVRVVYSESSDLFLGLSQGEDGVIEQPAQVRRRREPIRDVQRNAYLGSDGIYVRLGASWSDELMSLEPQERRAD